MPLSQLLLVSFPKSEMVYANRIAGPFELTKLSAQISVLMAASKTSSVDDPVKRSYQQKGALKTAQNIVLHRGVAGLYSGFHLHLCELIFGCRELLGTYMLTLLRSAGYYWDRNILYDLRER